MQAFVIMGVAGCGKSSVGAAIAQQIGAVFIDGDDLHPQANIDKMSMGKPLEDADRVPWLGAIGDRLAGQTSATIIACSALKRRYRDLIRAKAGGEVVFLHLFGARDVIEARMALREGHFMPVSLLDSQFRDLEALEDQENFIRVDIDQPFEAVVAAFVSEMHRGKPAADALDLTPRPEIGS